MSIVTHALCRLVREFVVQLFASVLDENALVEPQSAAILMIRVLQPLLQSAERDLGWFQQFA